ncbi:MAG TPA: nuclear transport factor 2 family protein [Candidatus Limnocylindrales bacterium]|nr:nuclear transport factor 2 family protein [Candidatus Limnocylindrales bacterium]
MTIDDVQAWLDRYVEAWRTYDPIAVGELFSPDAEYRYHPWGPPIQGRDLIVRSWLEPDGAASSGDAPGTYAARYRPWLVEGKRAVAIGTSDYWTDASRAALQRRYHNAFLLEFDPDGRCRSFTEFFMAQPEDAPGTG